MKKIVVLFLLFFPLTMLSAEMNLYGIYDDQLSDASILRGWAEAGMPAGIGLGGGAGVSFLAPRFYAEITGGYSYNAFFVSNDDPAVNVSGEEAVEPFFGMFSGLYAGGKAGFVIADKVKEKPFKWYFNYLPASDTFLFYDIEGPVHFKHIIGAGVKYLPTGSGWEMLRRDDEVFWQPAKGATLYLYPHYRLSKDYNFEYSMFELDDEEEIITDSILAQVKDYSGHSYYEGGLLASIDMMQLGGFFEYGLHSSNMRVCVGLGLILRLDAPQLSAYDLSGRLEHIFSGSSYYSNALCVPLVLNIGFPLETVFGGEEDE